MVGTALHLSLLILTFLYTASCFFIPEPVPEDLLSGHERIRKHVDQYEVAAVDTSDHLHRHSRQRRDASSGIHKHPSTTAFRIVTRGKAYYLKLQLNEGLFSKDFEIVTYSEQGERIVNRSIEHCYYHGSENSAQPGVRQAVISTCHGVSGFFQVDEQDKRSGGMYYIEPLTRSALHNGTHFHAVFRDGDLRGGDRLRFVGSDFIRPKTSSFESGILSKTDAHRRERRQIVDQALTIELYLIVDYEISMAVQAVPFFNIAVIGAASVADTFYKQVGFQVTLTGLEYFTAGNRFAINENDRFGIISNLEHYVRHNIMPYKYDTVQLLTSKRLGSGFNGIANLNAICAKNPVGIISGINWLYQVLIHEMAHNLGALHNTPTCYCYGNCFMDNNISISADLWTNCTRKFFKEQQAAQRYECLLEQVHKRANENATCGNSILELGEDCDCGSNVNCTKNPCCDARTCKTKAGFDCSSGACCHDCIYAPTGTICRGEYHTCDAPELCDGTSAVCPANLNARNGWPCGTAASKSFCLNGTCPSHEAKCKARWGNNIVQASEICYKSEQDNNCGLWSNGTAKRCAEADRLCGTLNCRIPSNSTITTLPLSRNHMAEGTTCFGLDFSNVSLLDPYADEFSTCGNGKVCIDRSCKNISSLQLPTCPSVKGTECAGNGVCSTDIRCVCRPPYSGSACESPASCLQPLNIIIAAVGMLHIAYGLGMHF